MWRDEAACIGQDPKLFFPETGQNGTRAKKICRWCPVKEECLEYALADPELRGIWGGVSVLEREGIRGRRERARLRFRKTT